MKSVIQLFNGNLPSRLALLLTDGSILTAHDFNLVAVDLIIFN